MKFRLLAPLPIAAAPVACIAAIGAGDINVLDVLVLAATFAALWLVVALGLHYSILKGH